MSEAEYLSLMNEYINTSFMLVSVLLSLISAFLIVSFLSADKFNRIITATLLFMYTTAYVWIGGATIASNNHIVSFAEKMQSSGIDFTWASFMHVESALLLANALVIASFFASIFFFFHSRRANRKEVRGEV